jgi:hypothetical protein
MLWVFELEPSSNVVGFEKLSNFYFGHFLIRVLD